MGQPGVLMMGTGPYKFDSLDPLKGVELSANPNYWGGKPSIQHISVKFISDEQSMALAFRAGDVDIAWPSNARAFEATAGTQLISASACNQGFLSMNTKVAPFNDVHVRRAIAYVLNKPDIIKAQGGFAEPDSTMIPPVQLQSVASRAQVAKLVKSIPTYPFSVAKAKAELAKSAYPNGFSTHIDTLQYGSY